MNFLSLKQAEKIFLNLHKMIEGNDLFNYLISGSIVLKKKMKCMLVSLDPNDLKMIELLMQKCYRFSNFRKSRIITRIWYTLSFIHSFLLYAASFPRVAECAFTLGRFDCHQDADHNSNRPSCWTHFTRKCKNRIAFISRRRVWLCSFFSCKQVCPTHNSFLTPNAKIWCDGVTKYLWFVICFNNVQTC